VTAHRVFLNRDVCDSTQGVLQTGTYVTAHRAFLNRDVCDSTEGIF